MSPAAMFPIGYVSLSTGLSAHVLRAWERRYAAVKPGRSSSGRRLYSQEDMERLELLKKAVAEGHSISQIAGLDNATLAGLTGPLHGSRPPQSQVDSSTDMQQTIDACLKALKALDDAALYEVLRQASLTISRKLIIDNLIMPFMAEVGRRWAMGDFRIMHEHLASRVVANYLTGMLTHLQARSAKLPTLLIATPAGQHCWLGAMAVAVIAQDHGWHPIFIGPDLPSQEIASAARSLEPQMIALSLTCRLDDPFVDSELNRLGELIDDQIPILVGGAASRIYRRSIKAAGAVLCPSSDTLIEQFTRAPSRVGLN